MSDTRYLRLRQQGLAWSEVNDETVILDLVTSTYFAASGSGSFILGCLAKGATQEDIVAQLVQRYEVDAATAATDVAGFLSQLESHNML